MIQSFQQTVEKHRLLADRDRLVVGVSGGADSVCLLHLLLRLRDPLHLAIHVAHLDHQLRGSESCGDARFVAQLAAQWDLPVTLGAVDVQGLAAGKGIGLEEAARQARYDFLARVALESDANKIAVGHHADDQAETLLMRLMRGTGLTGLRGMLPLASVPYTDGPLVLIRPLLRVSRAEILAYCEENGLAYRQDSTNLDPGYLRNRVRLDFLPLLDSAAPGLAERLAQTADLLAADELALEEWLQQVWPRLLVSSTGRTLVLDRDTWSKLPLGLQRRVVRRAVRELSRSPLARDLSYQHVDDVCRLARDTKSGVRLDLPGGLIFSQRYQRLVFHLAAAPEPVEYIGPLLDRPLALVIGDDVLIPGTRWTVRMRLFPADASQLARARSNPDPWQVFLDAEVAGSDLVLRPRRTAERMQPLGMEGHSVLVAEYMSDRHIPAELRDRLPLLCNAGHILWFVGWRIDERARLTTASKWVLHVTVQSSSED